MEFGRLLPHNAEIPAGGLWLSPAGIFSYKLQQLQRSVGFVGDGFQPFVGAALAGDLHGDMAEPAILFRTVPVLHLGGNHHHAAGGQAHGGLAGLLIPALTGGAQQKLPAALFGMMDVPVVAAARLKGHIGGEQAALGVRQGVEEGISNKLLGIGGVGSAGAEHIRFFKCVLILIFHAVSLRIYFFTA